MICACSQKEGEKKKNKPACLVEPHCVQLQPTAALLQRAGNGYSGVQTVHLFQHTNHWRDPNFFLSRNPFSFLFSLQCICVSECVCVGAGVGGAGGCHACHSPSG